MSETARLAARCRRSAGNRKVIWIRLMETNIMDDCLNRPSQVYSIGKEVSLRIAADVAEFINYADSPSWKLAI